MERTHPERWIQITKQSRTTDSNRTVSIQNPKIGLLRGWPGGVLEWLVFKQFSFAIMCILKYQNNNNNNNNNNKIGVVEVNKWCLFVLFVHHGWVYPTFLRWFSLSHTQFCDIVPCRELEVYVSKRQTWPWSSVYMMNPWPRGNATWLWRILVIISMNRVFSKWKPFLICLWCCSGDGFWTYIFCSIFWWFDSILFFDCCF